MALKIAGYLFTGPYDLDKTVVRRNHLPVIYAVLSKEGPPWDPVFRVIEIGTSGEDGIVFAEDARRNGWTSRAQGQLCLYLMQLEGAEYRGLAARESLARAIRARHVPPNDTIGVGG
jgi:hypothetical protein